MKWLLYTLVLVNLGIFVWHYQGLDKREDSSGAYDQTTRLVLLREYQARQEEASTKQKNTSTSTMCYSLGPFSKKAPANKVLAELKKDRIKAWQRLDTDSVRTGFWVYLPPAKTRNQAGRLLEQLREIKEKDFFLVATGQMKNAISLGVFSKAKLARARMEEINKQGFDAKVEKVTLPKRVYWVDWDKRAKKQPSDSRIEALREQFKGLGQTERRCSPDVNAGKTG